VPRIEIDLPERFAFSTDLPVRIGDINYGGHLGNDAVLALAQEARLQLLVSHGFRSELDIGGLGLIQADAAVVYRAEAHYGMVLRVELAFADVRTRGFDLLYRMSDAATGQEIARVKTGMLWFDYSTRKVVKGPEAFERVLAPAAA
jgi:4-hydroxybenzoyl-CoA thioesterase